MGQSRARFEGGWQPTYVPHSLEQVPIKLYLYLYLPHSLEQVGPYQTCSKMLDAEQMFFCLWKIFRFLV